jgi:hypothetical protein
MPGHDPLGVHVEVGSGSSGGFGEIADIAKPSICSTSWIRAVVTVVDSGLGHD